MTSNATDTTTDTKVNSAIAATSMSLREKLEARKRAQVQAPGADKSAPPIRKLANDFSMVMPGFARDAIAVDAQKFGGDGIYLVTPEVADYFIKHDREKLLFDASIHLAIDSDGQTFLTFAKVDPSRAASSYADALCAAEVDWTWVMWTGGRDGYYKHGSPPVPKAATSGRP